ncbi:MAG: DUF721 domain-containing protein [Chlorobi bacterium]|nr:DUF721 domain-containing protein [Chlorobiota bacterium]
MLNGGEKLIGEVLGKAKEFEKLRYAVMENDAAEKFAEIFPELAPIAEAVKVKKGTLYLRVENSVWKNELNLKRNILIKRINEYLNTEIVKSIRFK